jgi:integrase/recombinase XerD
MARIPDQVTMEHIEYRPARVCVVSGRHLVEFYARHPDNGRLVRVREYFDTIKDDRHRGRMMADRCAKVNRLLPTGWNPWGGAVADLGRETVARMIDQFLAMKKRELRARSIPNYITRCTRLLDWMAGHNMALLQCNEFSHQVARAYMDSLSGSVSARTKNNYLIDLKAMGNWAQKRNYWKKNPFHGIETVKEAAPDKRPLTDAELSAIMERIKATDPAFAVVCGLVYYCALRPQEICRLRVGQVDIGRGMIRISAKDAKDNESAWITVPKQFMATLASHCNGQSTGHYLIGQGCRPGPKSIFPTRLAERWAKHRDHCKLPKEVQLYALKDTAFVRLLASGASPATVRDHARHSSLEVTDAYIKTLRGYEDAEIRGNYPDMG